MDERLLLRRRAGSAGPAAASTKVFLNERNGPDQEAMLRRRNEKKAKGRISFVGTGGGLDFWSGCLQKKTSVSLVQRSMEPSWL